MKLTVLSFLALLLLSCNNPPKPGRVYKQVSPSKQVSPKMLINYLKNNKAKIDTFSNRNKKNITVFVKVTGKQEMMLVENEKWPDSIEYSYNVLKNATGKVVMIMQSPYSESGDWNIIYNHYFDESGKTFAFEREASFFNSECTTDDVAAHETTANFYAPTFTLLKQYYKLVDAKNKTLDKSKCVFNYNYEYTIYKDVNECLKAYHIKL